MNQTIHICKPFMAEGDEVWFDPCKPDEGALKLSHQDARERGVGFIVKCAMPKCPRPATQLDNYYPYYSELNRCAAHLEEARLESYKAEIKRLKIQRTKIRKALKIALILLPAASKPEHVKGRAIIFHLKLGHYLKAFKLAEMK